MIGSEVIGCVISTFFLIQKENIPHNEKTK